MVEVTAEVGKLMDGCVDTSCSQQQCSKKPSRASQFRPCLLAWELADPVLSSDSREIASCDEAERGKATFICKAQDLSPIIDGGFQALTHSQCASSPLLLLVRAAPHCAVTVQHLTQALW